MQKYSDFVEVVGAQPISDAMTLATRGMKDPASFLYAAAKREPAELRRISQIPDMYVQMAEMGKLEAQLKRKPSASKAPKPVSRSKSDSSIVEPEERELTLDDLLVANDRSRKSAFRSRY